MRLPRLTSDHGRRHKGTTLLLAALLALGLAGAEWTFELSSQPWFRSIDRPIHDAWARRFLEERTAQGSLGDAVSRTVLERLAIVALDRASVEAYGWPLPRGVYGELIRRLERAGARTIGLDILFGTAGAGDPEANESLRRALRRPSVVIPYELEPRGGRLEPSGLYQPLVKEWTPEDFRRRAGFTRELPDPDNQVRRALLEVETGGNRVSSFDTALVAHFLGRPREEVLDGIHHLQWQALGPDRGLVGTLDYLAADLETGTGLPAGEAGAPGLEVLRRGGPAPVSTIALSDVLTVVPMADLMEASEEELPGFFGTSGDGKPLEVLALVGVTVPGGHDLKASPVGPISGVAIHANILVNLLQDSFLRPVSPAEAALLMALMALLAGAAKALLEARVAFGSLGLLVALLYLGGAEAYLRRGLQIPFAAPALAMLLEFAVLAVQNVTASRAARDRFAKVLQEVAPIPDLEALLGT